MYEWRSQYPSPTGVPFCSPLNLYLKIGKTGTQPQLVLAELRIPILLPYRVRRENNLPAGLSILNAKHAIDGTDKLAKKRTSPNPNLGSLFARRMCKRTFLYIRCTSCSMFSAAYQMLLTDVVRISIAMWLI